MHTHIHKCTHTWATLLEIAAPVVPAAGHCTEPARRRNQRHARDVHGDRQGQERQHHAGRVLGCAAQEGPSGDGEGGGEDHAGACEEVEELEHWCTGASARSSTCRRVRACDFVYVCCALQSRERACVNALPVIFTTMRIPCAECHIRSHAY